MVHDDYEGALAAASDEPLADQPRGKDMLYSSGTTGRPKGVKAPLPDSQVHEAGDPLLPVFGPLYGFEAAMVYLSPAPLYHAAPLRFCGMVHQVGGTVVVMPRFDAAAALAAIEEYRVTDTQMVPTMFVRMLKLPEEERLAHDLSSMRVAVHAAAPCPVEVKRWSTTGDVGDVGDVGFLFLTDRLSFTIISGGVNIYPQEIEDALTLHPAVYDLAVIGIPDDDMGQQVKAVGEAYAADPLVYHGPLQRGSLVGIAEAVDDIAAGGGLGDLPTLWIHGDEDALAPLDETRPAFDVVGGTALESVVYPGARHEIFNETNKEEVLDDVVGFLHRSPDTA